MAFLFGMHTQLMKHFQYNTKVNDCVTFAVTCILIIHVAISDIVVIEDICVSHSYLVKHVVVKQAADQISGSCKC